MANALTALARRIRAALTKAPPEPDPLDVPTEHTEPTVDMFCMSCGEMIPCSAHVHMTPEGPFLHVETTNMDMHELLCKGNE